MENRLSCISSMRELRKAQRVNEAARQAAQLRVRSEVSEMLSVKSLLANMVLQCLPARVRRFVDMMFS